MSTIEEKLLDGPTIHYCDAGDDDIRSNEESDCDNDKTELTKGDASSLFIRPDEDNDLSCYSNHPKPHCSTNTGPKGVIEDHRKNSKCSKINDLDAEFQELLNDDSIIKEIAEKRIARERQSRTLPVFGQVFRLQTGTELLDSIDKEHPNVLVVVHIYTKYSRLCARVDKCLDQLADDMKHLKIVTLDASVAGLSENFKENGVPALLVYKGTNLVKSFVQLEEFLDRDFDHHQIKNLLMDNDLID